MEKKELEKIIYMTNKLLIIYSIKKILSKNNWKNRRNRKRN